MILLTSAGHQHAAKLQLLHIHHDIQWVTQGPPSHNRFFVSPPIVINPIVIWSDQDCSAAHSLHIAYCKTSPANKRYLHSRGTFRQELLGPYLHLGGKSCNDGGMGVVGQIGGWVLFQQSIYNLLRLVGKHIQW